MVSSESSVLGCGGRRSGSGVRGVRAATLEQRLSHIDFVGVVAGFLRLAVDTSVHTFALRRFLEPEPFPPEGARTDALGLRGIVVSRFRCRIAAAASSFSLPVGLEGGVRGARPSADLLESARGFLNPFRRFCVGSERGATEVDLIE